MPQTVNLTPPAFAEGNPNAQKNIAAAEAASERLKCAVTSKAQLLDDVVTVYFGNIDNLAKALRNHMKAMQEMRAVETAEELKQSYEAVNKAHIEASQQLHDAFTDSVKS